MTSIPSQPESFNPRPRVGGDLLGLGHDLHEVIGFNPRPRVGGDTLTGAVGDPFTGFQSTPPRRGRP